MSDQMRTAIAIGGNVVAAGSFIAMILVDVRHTNPGILTFYTVGAIVATVTAFLVWKGR